jgi:HEAT repeat protein
VTVNRQLQTDPEAAKRELAVLIEQLRDAPTDADKAVVLVAIGNTGHPDALPAIAPCTLSDSEQLRAAAVTAARLIPGGGAEAIIAASAVDDAISRVRMAAVDALGDRPATEGSLRALYTVATVDAAEQPRERARAVLDSTSLTDRSALPLLEAVAAYDRDNPRPSDDTQA